MSKEGIFSYLGVGADAGPHSLRDTSVELVCTHISILWCYSFLFEGRDYGESKITTNSPIERAGIRLLPSISPEFQALLFPERDKTFDNLLQYTALLKNDTDKPIAPYALLWKCTDAEGKLQTSEDAWFNFSSLPSATHLAGHSAKFITPFGADMIANPILGISSASDSTAQFFETRKTVEIALSAVMFSDGTVVGPDWSGWISRWQAYLQAEKETLSAAAKAAPGTLKASLMQLVKDASASGRGIIGREQTEDLGYGEFSKHFGLQIRLRSNIHASLVRLR